MCKVKKEGPPGQLWCTYHKAFEPIENFYKCPSKSRGYSTSCKAGEYLRQKEAAKNQLDYRQLSPVVFF